MSKSLVSLVLQNAPQVSERRRQAVLAAIAELGLPAEQCRGLAGRQPDPQHRRRHRRLREPVVRRPAPRHARGPRRLAATTSRSPTGTSTRTSGAIRSRRTCRCRWRGSCWPWRPTARSPTSAASPSSWPGRTASYRPARTSSPTTTPRVPGSPPGTCSSSGHRDVGHLTGAGRIAGLRRAAHESAMTDAGLTPVVTGGGATTEQDGYDAMRALLDRRPEVTAVFAANDVMLLGALAALRERQPRRSGRRVGGGVRQLPAGRVPLPGAHHRRRPQRRRRRPRRAGDPRPPRRARTARRPRSCCPRPWSGARPRRCRGP